MADHDPNGIGCAIWPLVLIVGVALFGGAGLDALIQCLLANS